MKKGLLIGCGSVFALFLLLGACVAVIGGGSNPSSNQASPSSSAPTVTKPAEKPSDQPKQEDKTITLEKYNKIKPGMSYEQVVKILGFEGTELSQNQIGGFKTIMYEWKNPDASNMNAIFQNNKLNTKSQAGLQ